MACEYGPIAFGALGVETTSRVKPLIYFLQKILAADLPTQYLVFGTEPEAYDLCCRSAKMFFIFQTKLNTKY
jgi:hypothetical protein